MAPGNFIYTSLVKSVIFSLTEEINYSNLDQLKIPDTEDVVRYDRISIHNRPINIVINKTSEGYQVRLDIGCQTNITLDEICRAMDELEGKDMRTTITSIAPKKSADSYKSKVEFLEESGNYLISKSLKAFSKDTHTLRESSVNTSVFTSSGSSSNRLKYNGYTIDLSGSKKDMLLNKLHFIRSILKYVTTSYFDKTF